MIVCNIGRALWFCLLCVASVALVPKSTEHITRAGIYYLLDDRLEYVHNYSRCDLLQDALNRFAERLDQVSTDLGYENDKVKELSSLTKMQIHINSGCDESAQLLWPTEFMREEYVVDVSHGVINIVAEQIWGILHALETVQQLIFLNRFRMRIIQSQLILDEPRFAHRGYLIDTSRHYLQTELILNFLDAMSMVKMNVLHWHIVDDTSFPYYSHTFPNLTLKGAYHPFAYIYTREDVLRVIQHARSRGIRVMSEFDTPGHTQCWGLGHPELLTQCFDNHGNPTNELGPIDPTRNSSYEFMEQLMNEVKQTFPDNFVHLGGDEVDFSCCCWYLNYIQYGNDWIAQYNCDPTEFGGSIDFTGTPEEISRVLGGEAAMWGEYVDDTNIFSRSW
ncbi:unnamed protein product [Echinostoma caproni]|uniref:beta-N-acetylhexosaminidase n=1 Tax=Echinostoma caproni TaxID=27848 RepID=A0A183ACV7_9TREM|nr:unnamed protein product [Echinostoma caproni]